LRAKKTVIRILAAAAAATLVFVLLLYSRPFFDPKGKKADHNVILVVIDALRADHLGIYGYQRSTSPNLDSFAGEGIIFDRGYSQASWTIPSMASYMTSLYQGVHRMSTSPRSEEFRVLSPRFVTLAESLKNSGMKTAAITSQVWFREKLGITEGFTEVISSRKQALQPREGQFLTDRALKWLDENGGDRFFLYLHYMGPHKPYTAPPPFKGRFTGSLDDTSPGKTEKPNSRRSMKKMARRGEITTDNLAYLMARYDEKLAYTDEQLGRLFDYLEESRLLDKTIIFVTADHGEAFNEHGNIYHGGSCYKEVIHVPMILRLPHGKFRGMRTDALAETIDIYPTIHDLLGLEIPAPIQGESLMPLIEGKGESKEAVVQGRETRIITREWSALINESGSSVEQLFYLPSDPTEQRNLAGENPVVEREMLERARNLRKSNRDLRVYYESEIKTVDLDDETIERLKSLGYLQ
jgi:arylsulfatase A-like enzyme